MSANAAGITFPWLRRIRVTFEGLTSGGTRTFESTGKQDSLRITCKVQKNIMGIGGTNIMIYNLSPDTRASFQRDTTKVKIEAGWDDGPKAGLNQCFYGSLITAVHNWAGSDIVTSLFAQSVGEDLARAFSSKTWGQGCSVKDIVLELAELLPNVEVDASRIKGLDGRTIGFGGWSHCDSVRQALDNLAREYAFSWTIEDGKFQAVGDDSNLGNCAGLSDPWLIDLNPILATSMQIAKGIKAKCAFEANMKPGNTITVTSTINPKFNGSDYLVNAVMHNIGCFGNDPFESEVVAFMDPNVERGL